VPSINLVTAGGGGTTATVLWGDVATETAYYVERCSGSSCTSGFSVVGNNLPANTTSFADSGLSAGTTYGYRIRASNLVGFSGNSAIAYLVTVANPPAAPTGLSATSSSDGTSVSLNWADNASNETSYMLQRCTGASCVPADYLSLAANTVSKVDLPTQPTTVYGYVVCAVNSGGTACSTTTFLTTGPVATVHYYIDDNLGSTSLIVSSSGAFEEEEMYYPYGGERWSNGTDPNHYKFTGKERDNETGLDYFGARYYGSNMGRWLSPDWSEAPAPVPYADLTDPQTLNLFGYVRNNPLGRVDADGHCCDFNDVMDFIAGAANAYGSDMLLGAGRVESTSTAGRIGQAVGDAYATYQGTKEFLVGATLEGGGTAADSTGVGAIVGIPA